MGEGEDGEGDGKFKPSQHPPPVQKDQSLETVSCQAGSDMSAHAGGGRRDWELARGLGSQAGGARSDQRFNW